MARVKKYRNLNSNNLNTRLSTNTNQFIQCKFDDSQSEWQSHRQVGGTCILGIIFVIYSPVYAITFSSSVPKGLDPITFLLYWNIWTGILVAFFSKCFILGLGGDRNHGLMIVFRFAFMTAVETVNALNTFSIDMIKEPGSALSTLIIYLIYDMFRDTYLWYIYEDIVYWLFKNTYTVISSNANCAVGAAASDATWLSVNLTDEISPLLTKVQRRYEKHQLIYRILLHNIFSGTSTLIAILMVFSTISVELFLYKSGFFGGFILLGNPASITEFDRGNSNITGTGTGKKATSSAEDGSLFGRLLSLFGLFIVAFINYLHTRRWNFQLFEERVLVPLVQEYRDCIGCVTSEKEDCEVDNNVIEGVNLNQKVKISVPESDVQPMTSFASASVSESPSKLLVLGKKTGSSSNLINSKTRKSGVIGGRLLRGGPASSSSLNNHDNTETARISGTAGSRLLRGSILTGRKSLSGISRITRVGEILETFSSANSSDFSTGTTYSKNKKIAKIISRSIVDLIWKRYFLFAIAGSVYTSSMLPNVVELFYPIKV